MMILLIDGDVSTEGVDEPSGDEGQGAQTV